MDVFFFIFIFFTVFVLCSMCGFCCKKKDEGAIFSTPVVVTSTTHQAPGSNYVVPTDQTTVPSQQSMPYPMQNQSAMPYPSQPIALYPPMNAAAPYPPMPVGNAAPYPPMNTGPISPYPPPIQSQQSMYSPPSYQEVISQAPYQKQAPYNPNYSGN
ncbi:hypothetical protein PVAND_003450 [Polypedilum vanderplanki]|uniref:Uncharacterized protein n=1 Tax=Polypedilum vanderplanki TaxID=319348 RepID=A0A9J6BV46_POLVA|nr:hypothetical protein PVAND_003450 [Polypedilum vanderplanki]